MDGHSSGAAVRFATEELFAGMKIDNRVYGPSSPEEVDLSTMLPAQLLNVLKVPHKLSQNYVRAVRDIVGTAIADAAHDSAKNQLCGKCWGLPGRAGGLTQYHISMVSLGLARVSVVVTAMAFNEICMSKTASNKHKQCFVNRYFQTHKKFVKAMMPFALEYARTTVVRQSPPYSDEEKYRANTVLMFFSFLTPWVPDEFGNLRQRLDAKIDDDDHPGHTIGFHFPYPADVTKWFDSSFGQQPPLYYACGIDQASETDGESDHPEVVKKKGKKKKRHRKKNSTKSVLGSTPGSSSSSWEHGHVTASSASLVHTQANSDDEVLSEDQAILLIDQLRDGLSNMNIDDDVITYEPDGEAEPGTACEPFAEPGVDHPH